jgi:hypothetical protein
MMMTTDEASKLIAIFTCVMPNTQKFDLENAAPVWSLVLSDITYDVGKMAVIKILRKKQISVLPLPGEIREEAKNIMASVKKNAPPDVYTAWDEVKRKLGSVSRNGIDWSHPIIRRTVQLIGAYEIATATYDIFPRFAKVYENLIARKENNYENKICYQIAQQNLDLFNGIEAPMTLTQKANERMLNGKDAIEFVKGA